VKTRAPIPYAELSSALRAQVHALESARADYLETLGFETGLRHAEALLSSPRPSASDRAQARALLSSAAEWAGRGRVEAKRLATRNLISAVEALDRGDLKLATLHTTWTVNSLVERRAELSRIALSVRRRLLSGLSS
jgi:predicted DNA-binding transcriptional regulator YafY